MISMMWPSMPVRIEATSPARRTMRSSSGCISIDLLAPRLRDISELCEDPVIVVDSVKIALAPVGADHHAIGSWPNRILHALKGHDHSARRTPSEDCLAL